MRDMENNHPAPNRSPAADLSLPHFDEEATLLSARPVVPLEEIKVKTRSKWNLIFALTIVAAILVGAIGATLLMRPEQPSRLQSEGEPSPALMSPTAAGGVTSGAAESKVESKVTAPPVVLNEEERRSEPLRNRNASTKQRPSASVSRNTASATLPRSPARPARVERRDDQVVEDFDADLRELRREERREARREARRQQRQRRERSDDLLRIREIFEGSPRP
jgi:hypothetical protein